MWTQEEMRPRADQMFSMDGRKRVEDPKAFKLNSKVKVRHLLIAASFGTIMMEEDPGGPSVHRKTSKRMLTGSKGSV